MQFCVVYLFYYPGAMPNQDLENALERLGNDAGTNLFVNKGKLNDPKYYKILSPAKVVLVDPAVN
jgi:hypothetical protein